MASIAVLPILIGLAVDYAIQLQARFDEAEEAGLGGTDAARAAATSGGPTIATACLATAAGFLALQLSPTPMVRSFGLLLIAGVGVAFLLALTAGSAALTLRRAALPEVGSAPGCPGGRVRERRPRPRPQDPPPGHAWGEARRTLPRWQDPRAGTRPVPSPQPPSPSPRGGLLWRSSAGASGPRSRPSPTSARWPPRASRRSAT